MKPTCTLFVQWIRRECGGHSHPAWVGMRPRIRWRAHMGRNQGYEQDATLTSLTALGDGLFRGELRFVYVPEAPLEEGVQLELLDGPRLIGVGKVIGVGPADDGGGPPETAGGTRENPRIP